MSLFKKIAKIFNNIFCKKKVETPKLEFRPYLWDIGRIPEFKRIEQLRPKLYDTIIKQADKYLNAEHLTVVKKPNDFVEDTHNYVSLATYYWEDPNDKNAPWIVKDGEVNPIWKEYDYKVLTDLVTKIRTLAIAYAITEDERYRECIKEQAEVWFLNKDTYMYPTMEYCQIGVGHNNNEGINTLESYLFIHVFEGIALCNMLNPFDDAFISGLKQWLSKFIVFLETSKQGSFENNLGNNHSIMYDVGLIYFNIVTEGVVDQKLKKRLADRIKKQVNEDGKQPKELKRPSAMHYSLYNIEHMIDASKILENTKSDFADDVYRRMNTALYFLIAYDDDTKEYWEKDGYTETYPWKNCMDYLHRELGRVGWYEYDFTQAIDFIVL